MPEALVKGTVPLVAGERGGGGGAPTCCASLERILTIIRFTVVDMIPVRRQNLESKLKVLELAGRMLSGYRAES